MFSAAILLPVLRQRHPSSFHQSTCESPARPRPDPLILAESFEERAGKLAADLAVNPLTYLVAIGLSVWLVNVLGESDLTIFVLAAFPIVGLTALSKSPVGEQVAKSLEAELPGVLSPRVVCIRATAIQCMVKEWP